MRKFIIVCDACKAKRIGLYTVPCDCGSSVIKSMTYLKPPENSQNLVRSCETCKHNIKNENCSWEYDDRTVGLCGDNLSLWEPLGDEEISLPRSDDCDNCIHKVTTAFTKESDSCILMKLGLKCQFESLETIKGRYEREL